MFFPIIWFSSVTSARWVGLPFAVQSCSQVGEVSLCLFELRLTMAEDELVIGVVLDSHRATGALGLLTLYEFRAVHPLWGGFAVSDF